MEEDPRMISKPLIDTTGFKFSNDIVLLESFFKQQGWDYNPHELEMTPFGLGLRIKRDKEEMMKQLPEVLDGSR